MKGIGQRLMRVAPGLAGVTLLLAMPALASGTIFGLKSRATSPGSGEVSEPPTVMFALDDAATTLTTVGTVTLAGTPVDADGMAVSGSGQVLAFVLEGGGSRLVRLDTGTAAATPIGAVLPGMEIRGAAFGPGGDLVVIDVSAGVFRRVDPATGEPIGVASSMQFAGIPYIPSDGSDVAFRADGVCFLCDLGAVFTVDLSTGVLTRAFSAPGQFFAGAAFTAADPSTLTLYEVNFTDDIVALPTHPLGALVPRLADILSEFNAGRGDLGASVVAPCRVDFNGDTILDPDDLADFIACYFGETSGANPCAAADFSGDGTADPDDLADFIAGYFAGC